MRKWSKFSSSLANRLAIYCRHSSDKWEVNVMTTGAYHLEPETAPYSCHGVFTDRSVIYSLNLSRIQMIRSPQERQWPIAIIRTDQCQHVDMMSNMFTWGRILLSLPRRAHVDWNWPISRVKYLKIDWSVKMPLQWLIMGVESSW